MNQQRFYNLLLTFARFEESRNSPDFTTVKYHYIVSIVLISISLLLQIFVAIALVFKSRYNIDNELEYVNANRIDNCIILGILLITIANVISSAFAPATISPDPRHKSYFSSFIDLMKSLWVWNGNKSNGQKFTNFLKYYTNCIINDLNKDILFKQFLSTFQFSEWFFTEQLWSPSSV